ncbi:prephenate dehydrogenase [Tuwongella immobilis]|nr:prephenate dehydrogenase/arogenate dehydrogenase family protein [Tuwongella immobilis]
MMRIGTLGIVGVGLIGGSIGLAARERGIAQRVIGIGRQTSSLQQALDLGLITEFTTDLVAGGSQADLTVFCTPVDLIGPQVRQLAPHLKPGTILTDAGSTKERIVQAVEGILPQGVAFIGSHPLAGSHRRGPDAAKADLFCNRLTILTPTPTSDPHALATLTEFWQALGSRVQLLDAATHDRALGTTSHLPHAVASALASVLPEAWQPLTATGFRDTTRLAAADPTLWTAIFRENQDAVRDALDRFEAALATFRQLLAHDDADALHQWLTNAKQVRDALGS